MEKYLTSFLHEVDKVELDKGEVIRIMDNNTGKSYSFRMEQARSGNIYLIPHDRKASDFRRENKKSFYSLIP